MVHSLTIVSFHKHTGTHTGFVIYEDIDALSHWRPTQITTKYTGYTAQPVLSCMFSAVAIEETFLSFSKKQC